MVKKYMKDISIGQTNMAAGGHFENNKSTIFSYMIFEMQAFFVLSP